MGAADEDSADEFELAPDTLAALQSFLDERQQKQEEFEKLVAAVDEQRERKRISVEDFLRLFGEDWQVSQFWYSPAFANKLAALIKVLCKSENSKIAFISCPTAYVAFQHAYDLPNVSLMEFDERFKTFAADEYCHWDLHQPLKNLPTDFIGETDIAIVDPPFLNERTNKYVSEALLKLLQPDGKVILLTSTSVSDILPQIYNRRPIGPLKETKIKVQHNSGIANAFAVWTNCDGGEHWNLDNESTTGSADS